MRITSVVEGVSGFGAGVRAFKTAMKLLGVFTSNTMPDPVSYTHLTLPTICSV